MTNGFKKKTIESIISSKMKGFVEYLKRNDKELGEEFEKHYIVTGGAITSMLLGELPNDYDVYFDNPQTAQKVASFYIKNYSKVPKVSRVSADIEGNRVKIFIKSVGVVGGDDLNGEYKYFEGESRETLAAYMEKFDTKKNQAPYQPLLISSNAISLTNDIQLIFRFTGSPEEIHKNYDFVHTTNYYTPKTGLVLNQPALESTISKELKYVGSLYPICTLFRIRKFIQRGWTITAGEILKIAFDVSNLDLTNPKVLEDQLVGVDYAYFYQIVEEIKSAPENLDRVYLFEIINRVFDEDLREVDLFVKENGASNNSSDSDNDDDDRSYQAYW